MQVSIVLFAFVYESQPKVNKANFLVVHNRTIFLCSLDVRNVLASFIDVLRGSFFSSVLSQYID